VPRWTSKDIAKKGLRVSGNELETPDFIPGKIFIPFNVPSKKNSKNFVKLRNGKKKLVSSDACKKYEKAAKRYYLINAPVFRELTKDLKPPYTVFFKLVRATKQRFDYGNILQMVQDMMVECEWLEDDNADFLLPIPIQYEIDKENPGVFIWV
jgi:Holliday junction resolvase RusA-like endonuclease